MSIEQIFLGFIRYNKQMSTVSENHDTSCYTVKFSHGNMAYVMIMLFINIELFMVDNYISKGFPGQLHEALCKCIGMILA